MNILDLDPMGSIGRVIANYAGEPASVELIIDPFHEATYALKVIFKDEANTKLYFLLRDVALDKLTVADLEEVEFTAWPPTFSM